MRQLVSFTLLGAALALAGCAEGDASAQAQADAGAPLDAGTDAAPAQAQTKTAAAAPEPKSRAPLELLKMTLTTGVEKKAPVDTVERATAGERVYAHLTIRNRSGERRKVHVDFLVNGKLRTPLELEIEPSWSYRTWGYNTLQPSDRGELEVRVLDDAGATLTSTKVPIVAKSK